MSQEDDFWTEVILLIKPIEPVRIEYRLHYNEQGEIIMCSMANHPESTQYIVTSQEEYQNYFAYRVVDNKLKKIDTDTGYRIKLAKSTTGYLTIKNHAGLIIEPGEEYREIEYYASTN